MSEVKTVEMTLTKEGTFELTSLDKQLAYANSLITKGLVSDTYKNPSQLVLAIQTCLALGVEPTMGLKWSYVISGKPAFFGDFPLMMVQKSGFVESIEEFFVNDKLEKICFENKNIKDKVFAAFCRVKRKGDAAVLESFFTVDEASMAGLFKNQTWNKYTKDMLMYRTRGRALRAKFPDALGGLEIAEFIEGVETKETEKERANNITRLYSDVTSEVSSTIDTDKDPAVC
jgi:hypothetical protein